MCVFKWQKLMQNCRPPSFFLTNTTALHHAFWLGQIAPDSNISQRWFSNLLNQRQMNLPNSFLKRMSFVTFIVCSVEWVQPNSAGSNENTLSYLAKSQQAASAISGGQESNPLKSSSSNSFHVVAWQSVLGHKDPGTHFPPPLTGLLLVTQATGLPRLL